MRSFLLASATIAAALTISATGLAQKPPKAGDVTLKDSAAQFTYSAPVTLTGKVKGA